MRLIGQVKGQLDITTTTDAACHGEFRSCRCKPVTIRDAAGYELPLAQQTGPAEREVFGPPEP